MFFYSLPLPRPIVVAVPVTWVWTLLVAVQQRFAGAAWPRGTIASAWALPDGRCSGHRDDPLASTPQLLPCVNCSWIIYWLWPVNNSLAHHVAV